MSKQPNFKMIELARQSRGLTQKDLAYLLDNVHQSIISRIEKGELNVSTNTLTKISKILGYPIEFFFEQDLRTPFSNIYFRKRTSIKQKTLDTIFAQIKIILKSIDKILDSIELKEYPRYAFNITEGWTPESAAIRVREIFGVPSGPVKNIIKTIEEEGIIVYFYDCKEERFDGLTAYSDNGHPVIIINRNLSNDRIRFTVSHELAHLCLHIPCDVEPWRDVENEANNFASEFLMPAKNCISDLTSLTYGKLGMIKSFWGVSKAFIIRRAKMLNKISESTYKYFMVELGRKGERKNETGFVEVDYPNILPESIMLIKAEYDYSESDFAKVVNLYEDDYTKYFNNEKKLLKLKTYKQVI